MRLWSVHPRYLDRKGLVALWREGLLAQKVLQGKTKGYRHHPQLERFKNYDNPRKAISFYLKYVWSEAKKRGYHFKKGKISPRPTGKVRLLRLGRGQLIYEFDHLKKKLRQRAPQEYKKIASIKRPQPHPFFRVIKGTVAAWERPIF